MAKKKTTKKKAPVRAPAHDFKCQNSDCVKALRRKNSQTPGMFDLAFADPPYNIGYEAYDSYKDKQPESSYLYWMSEWMYEIYYALKRNGSFWLAMCDEYVAPAEMIATQHKLLDTCGCRDFGTMKSFPGFKKRAHVVWYYTFGVAGQRNYSRSHTHLLYFTKSKSNFYFDDEAVRVPSMRELVYGDKRAKKGGKMPDNTWILTPDALAKCFGPEEDTWLVSRVAGTFKEREHRGTYQKEKGVPQMPEEILDRIVRSCCPVGGNVLDPFLGTGTTGVAAVRHGCAFLGYDVSKAYVQQSKKRIEAAAKARAAS